MGISVGDKVQIRAGGIDVTNGVKAKAGKLYGEGGPKWATVTKIVENWDTGGKYGLPRKVTKVRCSDGNVVVWQVRPEDIASQSIKADEPPTTEVPAIDTGGGIIDPTPIPGFKVTDDVVKPSLSSVESNSNTPFTNERGSNVWTEGVPSTQSTAHTINTRQALTNVSKQDSPNIIDTAFDGSGASVSYIRKDITPKGKNAAVPKSVNTNNAVYEAKFSTAWEDKNKRREMRNQDTSIIQNSKKFPYHEGPRGDMLADRYDYQIIPGDSRYPLSKSLADQLTRVRAELGIQVHGNNDIARSVKFYMYNRYKSPDTNLLYNKTVTHVFFTRPDLNLLENPTKANNQTLNHTDTALLWKRNPELFKLLTDYSRCNDNNNFNMLLSNQITSFSLNDESLATIRAGSSWAGHEITYGEQYTGRTSGEFTCGFAETSEFSVINLLKLWMTYIDNVSRGAWSPNYKNGQCHVYDRALDYGASVYVFKCGPDGEDVLYWSKYYGVFPIVSGASALSWNAGTPIGDPPTLSITFAYSYKRDMSPISLLEFNHVANVDGNNAKWVPIFSGDYAHCVRPYVGPPYIEMDLGIPQLQPNDVSRSSKRTQIRLKFRDDSSYRRTDNILYRDGGSSDLNSSPGVSSSIL